MKEKQIKSEKTYKLGLYETTVPIERFENGDVWGRDLKDAELQAAFNFLKISIPEPNSEIYKFARKAMNLSVDELSVVLDINHLYIKEFETKIDYSIHHKSTYIKYTFELIKLIKVLL